MNLKCILKTRKNPYGESLYGEKLDSFESYTLCDSLRELCALCGEKSVVRVVRAKTFTLYNT